MFCRYLDNQLFRHTCPVGKKKKAAPSLKRSKALVAVSTGLFTKGMANIFVSLKQDDISDIIQVTVINPVDSSLLECFAFVQTSCYCVCLFLFTVWVFSNRITYQTYLKDKFYCIDGRAAPQPAEGRDRRRDVDREKGNFCEQWQCFFPPVVARVSNLDRVLEIVNNFLSINIFWKKFGG